MREKAKPFYFVLLLSHHNTSHKEVIQNNFSREIIISQYICFFFSIEAVFLCHLFTPVSSFHFLHLITFATSPPNFKLELAVIWQNYTVDAIKIIDIPLYVIHFLPFSIVLISYSGSVYFNYLSTKKRDRLAKYRLMLKIKSEEKITEKMKLFSR